MGLEEEHGWVVRMIQAQGFEDASSARPGKKGKDKSRGRGIGRRVGYLFDAFPVETVYVSEDPNSTLTYNTFLRGVRDEGAQTEVLRAGMLMDWGGVRADA